MPGLDFTGKVALVTAAGAGIGKACCRQLTQLGASVAAIEVDQASAKRLENELASSGLPWRIFVGDAADPSFVEPVVDAIKRDLGHLDVLLNVAGTNLVKSLDEFSLSEWEEVLRKNLTATFVPTRYALPIMKKRRSGSIVNVASTFGMLGYPRVPAYAAAKGGIIALTRQLARDFGPLGIRVNAICPGPTRSERLISYMQAGLFSEADLASQVPLGRMADPEEIARVAVFLASDAASYLHGAVVAVDGGQTAHIGYLQRSHEG